MSVWNELDEKNRKAQREQNEAKGAIEACDGWKFKGWEPRAVPGGVVWVAKNGRRALTIERPTIEELVSAVKAKHADIEQAKQEGRA